MKIHISEESFISRVEKGDTEAVKLLLKAGIQPHVKNHIGTPVLTIAVKRGHTEIVKALIKAGAYVDARSMLWMTTPLMVAAWEGHTEIAKALIKAGADVNAEDEYGRTALMIAAKRGHTEIAKALIKAGSDVNVKVAIIGLPAPDFELRDVNGNLWKLSDLRGKVIFISFWATWDTTGKKEMPYKESLYRKMRGKPFQMLGILFRDNPRNLISYFQKQKVSAPTLIDPNNEVTKAYGVTGVPETFIIDKNGILREKIVGPREWDSSENITLIEKWIYGR